MKRFFDRYLPFIFMFFLVSLGAMGGYFYKNNIFYKFNPTRSVNQTPSQSLIEEVGRLIVLPTDETPTIATVSDPTALQNQVFFADAKEGDKVLIYTSAKKAVLYDPVIKKIVNVAPVNVGDPKNTIDTTTNTNTTNTPASQTPNQF